MKISTKNSDSNLRFGFKGKLLSVLFLVTMLLGAIQTQAQFDIVSTATNYTENFNALASTGTGNAWSNNSTLTGWYARTDATASITTYNANTGSSTTAALNSFGVAGTNPVTERALGYSPTNAFFGASGTGKGYIGWRLTG